MILPVQPVEVALVGPDHLPPSMDARSQANGKGGETASARIEGASILAQDEIAKPTEGGKSDTAKSLPLTSMPHFFGQWGGLLPRLAVAGIEPRIQYIWNPAYNVQGGDRSKLTLPGQFTVGAGVDLEKLVGLKDTRFQFLITNRRGDSISDDAGLGLLNNAQGIFGGGQIWRLSQLSLSKKFGRFELKAGRMSVAEDFGTGDCFFESLYFCGTAAGHVGNGYWYNPPTAVWGARVRRNDKDGYTQVGMFELNPLNATRGFYLGFAGRTGFLLPVERGFSVHLHGNPRLAGLIRAGFWYDTSSSNDLVRDIDGGFSLVSGKPLALKRGRWGAYIAAKQQLVAPRPDGSGAVSMMFNAVEADPRTARNVNKVTVGVRASGLIPSRPKDELGVAIGRIRANGRLADALRASDLVTGKTTPQQHSEYAVEIDYSIAVAPGLSVRPNVQLYKNPGGRSDRTSVIILGTGLFLTL
jgi:porin